MKTLKGFSKAFKRVIFYSLMSEFYRRILSNVLETDSPSTNDIIMSQRACVIIYLMNKFELLSKESIKVGIFSTTEQELFKMIKLPKITNNQLYDFLMYLDSIGELDNYLSLESKQFPKYDSFYKELNEKLGLGKTKKTLNKFKKCPKCKMIPYFDFVEVCDICKNKLEFEIDLSDNDVDNL